MPTLADEREMAETLIVIAGANARLAAERFAAECYASGREIVATLWQRVAAAIGAPHAADDTENAESRAPVPQRYRRIMEQAREPPPLDETLLPMQGTTYEDDPRALEEDALLEQEFAAAEVGALVLDIDEPVQVGAEQSTVTFLDLEKRKREDASVESALPPAYTPQQEAA